MKISSQKKKKKIWTITISTEDFLAELVFKKISKKTAQCFYPADAKLVNPACAHMLFPHNA